MAYLYKQQGFTLVELAISLMVIGLLIGGILKGQELVENARVTSTTRQITATDTAVAIFRNTYDAIPGDIKNPAARIPNCTMAPCNAVGNGDKRIDGAGTGESLNFWIHLAKANMVSGVDATQTTYDNIAPPTAFGGQVMVRYEAQTGYTGNTFEIYDSYFAETGLLKPSASAQIDRKLDDGKPRTGDIRGDEGGSSDPCIDWVAMEYLETNKGATCLTWAKLMD